MKTRKKKKRGDLQQSLDVKRSLVLPGKKIIIVTNKGRLRVPLSYKLGIWGVHRTHIEPAPPLFKWVLTHLPTGLCVRRFSKREHAIFVGRAIRKTRFRAWAKDAPLGSHLRSNIRPPSGLVDVVSEAAREAQTSEG